MRRINSPRHRCACRPSLLRKEGEKISDPSLPLAVERVVERSKDRVSQHGDLTDHAADISFTCAASQPIIADLRVAPQWY
jgi:hypothetical protein